MLKFIAKNGQTYVLTEQEGVMLGYIDENNVFFPNNNMMFKVEWLKKIVEKIDEISWEPKNELSQEIADKLIQAMKKLNKSLQEQVAQFRELNKKTEVLGDVK